MITSNTPKHLKRSPFIKSDFLFTRCARMRDVLADIQTEGDTTEETGGRDGRNAASHPCPAACGEGEVAVSLGAAMRTHHHLWVFAESNWCVCVGIHGEIADLRHYHGIRLRHAHRGSCVYLRWFCQLYLLHLCR